MHGSDFSGFIVMWISRQGVGGGWVEMRQEERKKGRKGDKILDYRLHIYIDHAYHILMNNNKIFR
jgi:predicted transcriptional regulator